MDRPVLLTSVGVAMEQVLIKYEKTNEEFAFIKAISLGLIDIKEGNTMDLIEAKRRLGIA